MCPDEEQLTRFVRGDRTLDGLEQHLMGCLSCQTVVAELMNDSGEAPASGAAPARPPDRFEILRPLGEGGMSRVYEAEDRTLGRRVALKFVRFGEGALGDGGPQREARALARLSHPNVVQVYDLVQVPEGWFVVRELIDGEPLDAWLRTPRTTIEVLRAMVQAGRGLAAAHQASVLHRDVKPANVLVGRDGRVRIADFGLAAVEREAEQAVSGGTPAYLAPERWRGEPGDERADQFSFCVALFEALTGQRPFGDPRRPGAVSWPRQPNVPAHVRRAIERGLSVEPAARFASMGALVSALERRPVPRAALAAAALSVLVLGAVAGQRFRQARRCEASAARADAWWSPAARSEVEAAFVKASGETGRRAFGRASATLDGFVRAWSRAEQARCEHPTARSDATQACLERRLAELGALLALYRGANATLAIDAPRSSRALAAPQGCDSEPLAAAPSLAPVEVRQLLAELTALMVTGQYAAVLPTLEPKRALLAGPGLERERATTALLEGQARLEVGDSKGAEHPLFEAAALGQEARLPEVAVRSWLLLARRARGLGQLDEAERWVRQGQAIASEVREPTVAVELANARGTLLAERGEGEKAAAEQRAALELAEKLEGPDAPLSLKVRRTWAYALLVAGRPAEATEVELGLLDRLVALYGEEHPDVARMHLNLSASLAKGGRHADAFAHAERALALSTATLGPKAPELIDALNNMAALKALAREYPVARTLQRRALELTRASFGDAHPRVARTLANLSQLELRADAPADAQALADQALQLLGRLGRSERADALPPLLTRCELELVAGRFAQAEAGGRGAAALADRLGQPQSRARARVLAAAAALERDQARPALELVEQAAPLRETLVEDPLEVLLFDTVEARARLAVHPDDAAARVALQQVLGQLERFGANEKVLALEERGARRQLAATVSNR